MGIQYSMMMPTMFKSGLFGFHVLFLAAICLQRIHSTFMSLAHFCHICVISAIISFYDEN